MKNSSKTVAYLGLCTALAMIMSYAEMLIPPIFPTVPGIKIGLPNVIIIYMLYNSGFGKALLVSVTRVIAVALLFGNVTTFMYSLTGAVLSILAMMLLKKTNLFSCVGVSVAGAVIHNLGQILVAILILESMAIGYYMIILTITGTIAGIIVGILGSILIKRL